MIPKKNSKNDRLSNETFIPFMLSFCGVICPLVGLLITALRSYGILSISESLALDLTAGGKFWVHPERDISIYIFGIILIVSYILWIPWGRIRSPESSPQVAGISRIGAVLGISLMLKPLFFWKSTIENSNTNHGVFWLFSFLAISISAYNGWRIFISKACFSKNPDSVALTGDSLLPHLNFFDLLVFVSFGIFIVIPDVPLLCARIFQIEEFYHWNALAASASLAYLKGGVLYKDFIPQYGVGWPVLFAVLNPIFTLSYKHLIQFAMCFSVAYFFGLFYLLRTLGYKRYVSFSIVFLSVVILVLPGFEPESKSVVWRWNGGVAMRAPLEIPFFITLFYYLSTPKRMSAILLGALAGMAPLFSVDAGFFLLTTGVSTLVFLLLFTRRKSVLPDGLWAAGAASLFLLLGLMAATRGTFFSDAVLGTIFSSVSHSAGEAQLPFAGLDRVWVAVFALAVILFLGSIVMSVGREISLRGAREGFAWAIGIYGLQRMVYFMGRTTWGNLTVLLVPSVICICYLMRDFCQYRGSTCESKTETSFNWVGVLGCVALNCATLVYVYTSKDTENYPALWNAASKKTTIFGPVSFSSPSFGVNGLPEPYRQYVQSLSLIASRLRELKDQGGSVQVLDSCATTLYLLAGIAPYGKTFDEFGSAGTSRRAILNLKTEITTTGPDFIALNKASFPWPRTLSREAWQTCRDDLFSNYQLYEEYGFLELWRRKAPRVN